MHKRDIKHIVNLNACNRRVPSLHLAYVGKSGRMSKDKLERAKVDRIVWVLGKTYRLILRVLWKLVDCEHKGHRRWHRQRR